MISDSCIYNYEPEEYHSRAMLKKVLLKAANLFMIPTRRQEIF